MATTVEIRKEEVGKAKDLKSLMARLRQEYKGSWVAILDTGELVSNKTLEGVYSEVKNRGASVSALFYASDERELLFRQARTA